MEIHFLISEKLVNDMSIEDYEAFERAQDGEIKLYKLRPAICRFMVDEKNIPIPHERALKVTGKMKVPEVRSFIEQFFNTITNATVPKGNGSPSVSPSEVQTVVDSVSPDG